MQGSLQIGLGPGTRLAEFVNRQGEDRTWTHGGQRNMFNAMCHAEQASCNISG